MRARCIIDRRYRFLKALCRNLFSTPEASRIYSFKRSKDRPQMARTPLAGKVDDVLLKVHPVLQEVSLCNFRVGVG